MPHSAQNVVAVLLAGGPGERLHELTADICKPALAMAGGRRMVDWSMDNLVRARPARVLVVTQYRPASLISHLGARWRNGFPPGALVTCDSAEFPGCSPGYRGTADAVARNLGRIAAAAPDVVLVVAADLVCRLDYSAMIRAHRDAGQPVSVAFDRARGPMDVHVFDWAWLRDTLLCDGDDRVSGHDLDDCILLAAASNGQVHIYDVATQEPGLYWRDIDTLDSLRQTCIELEGIVVPCARPAYPCGSAEDQPTRILPQGTVVLPGAMVSRGARLRNAIVAPGAVVPGDLVAGFDPDEDARHFRVTPDGTVLITPLMLARRSAGAMRRMLMPRHDAGGRKPPTHRSMKASH